MTLRDGYILRRGLALSRRGLAVSRRGLALLAASALPTCTDFRGGAIAQSGGGLFAGGSGMPDKMPCPSRPGDIVGLVLEGTGAPAGAVTVFGQAFRRGAVPAAARLHARQTNGTPLRAQLDVKTRHPDGSARFGVVSLAAPALRPGEKLGVLLAAESGGAEAPPLDLAGALAGRQAVLELQAPDSQALRVDLLARLRAALADRSASPWQAGPLASQARASLVVPPAAVGGVTSLRLVFDIAARADGTLWVDAWLRNDATMRPGGGPITYSLRILLDGREALKAEAVTQAQYTGWGRLLGAASGGRAAHVPAFMRMDTTYLAELGAVHNYDLSVGVDEAQLIKAGQAVEAPDWATPLGNRSITQYMPMTGGRQDIGPASHMQAAWLITGDPRVAAYVQGQAEAAGAVPWHFWDPAGGADNKGGWLDTKHWPGFWLDGRNGPPPKSLLQPASSKPWVPDTAHQPDLSYVPYLLTGRRAFLDGLQAQAIFSIISTWPAQRSTSGVVVVERRQVRGAAWCLRQIDEAAWMSPPDDPNAAYLQFAAKENWAWLVAQIPEWTVKQGEAHGWLVPGEFNYIGGGGLAPWQQDFFATTVIASARRGNPDAITYLNWASNYLVGRFLADQRGFSYRDAVTGVFTATEPPPSNRWFTTWAEIGASQVARKVSNGDGWSQGTPIYAMATLAGIISLGGPAAKDARRAFDKLTAVATPDIMPNRQRGYPTFNIVPRGGYRNPGSAPACAPHAGPA